MIANTAPMIAPTLGASLLALAGWRSIYATLAVGGILLLGSVVLAYRETLATGTRPERSITAELGAGLNTLLAARASLAQIAIYGLSFGSLFAYIAGSPLVFIDTFKVSPLGYAALFACTACGIVLGAFLSGRAMHRFGERGVTRLGLALALAGPLAALAAFLSGRAGVETIAPAMVVATFGYGLIAPAASKVALEPLADIAGLAAALMNAFQMMCAAFASAVIAFAFAKWGGEAMPIVMVAFAILSGVAAVWGAGAGEAKAKSSQLGLNYVLGEDGA
jgi:MFS transporter, DHA1 family, multidrug resistance protein